jgi:hypothetical protein
MFNKSYVKICSAKTHIRFHSSKYLAFQGGKRSDVDCEPAQQTNNVVLQITDNGRTVRRKYLYVMI